ncbi:MAG: GNAT family N-acetyltransferase [Burkholderiales bacterium]|nr:GNAT family N-acetyltransferase [Burkholderiales bacterium]
MWDEALLSRVEDAGINASAPVQQRWFDGWILRYAPVKAKRSRCINAVAEGRLGLDERLALAAAVYRDADLPMVLRLSRFSRPPALDAELEARGYRRFDETRVMVRTGLATGPQPALAPDLEWAALDGPAFAATIGALRGSPADQVDAHAVRLGQAPVRHQGFAIRRGGLIVACGQFTIESGLVGLYDVHTLATARGQGLATQLCMRLLSLAAAQGGETAYLQVEADNEAARRIYRGLGFADAYEYHYRAAPGA